MNKIDRRSALGIGLAAASATIMKPATAQTVGYKDTTPWPGVVVRAYEGETPAIIPGFKTVSMRDVIMQPGSKTMGPPMENAMVCHIPEGELRIEQEGKTFTSGQSASLSASKWSAVRYRLQASVHATNERFSQDLAMPFHHGGSPRLS